MARREQPLDPDSSPIQALAYGLRLLRDESGMDIAQLRRRASFSSTTLYDAFAGKQFPSQQVTLAIVKVCGGDEEAWRSYWMRMRRALGPDAPEGTHRSLVPPWATHAAQSDTGADVQVRTIQDDGVVAEGIATTSLNPYTIASDADQLAAHEADAWWRSKRIWLGVAAGLAVGAAIGSTIVALSVGNEGRATAGGSKHTRLAVVVVQNKDAIGSSSLLEGSTPAYLSSRPVPFCHRLGCEVKGTDMSSGADLTVSCWVHGAEMTNENTQTAGIAHNPNGVTSTLWYRAIWPDGRTGFLSEVYVEPKYRGGLGLPTCKS